MSLNESTAAAVAAGKKVNLGMALVKDNRARGGFAVVASTAQLEALLAAAIRSDFRIGRLKTVQMGEIGMPTITFSKTGHALVPFAKRDAAEHLLNLFDTNPEQELKTMTRATAAAPSSKQKKAVAVAPTAPKKSSGKGAAPEGQTDTGFTYVMLDGTVGNVVSYDADDNLIVKIPGRPGKPMRVLASEYSWRKGSKVCKQIVAAKAQTVTPAPRGKKAATLAVAPTARKTQKKADAPAPRAKKQTPAAAPTTGRTETPAWALTLNDKPYVFYAADGRRMFVSDWSKDNTITVKEAGKPGRPKAIAATGYRTTDSRPHVLKEVASA